jgi:UDP-GlcNAc:undecaprenyl-phosphate GlcNAc-1-phosphate transferase
LLAVLALGLCLLAPPIGRLIGVVDSPDGRRKDHTHDTPQVGGLAVMLPALVMALILAQRTDFVPFYGVVAILLTSSLLLGLVDDRRHVRPMWRLAISVAMCFAALYAVPALNVTFLKFSFVENAIYLGDWAALFTVLCLVGLQNAVNMADGKNGIVIGLSLLWVMALMAFGPLHLRPLLVVFAAGLAIALPFNLRGHLFLGDAGTYAISIVIGALTLYVYSVNFAALPADFVMLWFLVPVLDCLRLMVARVISGRSPFSSDRRHLHHVLWQLLPPHGALAVYLGLVGAPALLSALAPEVTHLLVVLALSCYASILGLGRWRLAARSRAT